MLRKKIEESKIQKASQAPSFRIIDEAKVSYKTKPRLIRNVIYSLLFFLIALVFGVILKEFLDQSIKSVDSIQKLGVSVIGIIPQIGLGRKYKHKKFKNELNGEKNSFTDRLITHLDPLNPVSEAYRSIRTNISYALPEKEVKTIMISSPGPSEGKTTTSINLAIAFSQLEKKTLIVDTDLRKPIVHRIFDTSRDPGIADFLVDKSKQTIDEYIRETQIKNLFLVSSGKLYPNPSELLGSERMQKFINLAEEKFDLIIFDSPPIIAVTDARVIASDVDIMLLIVKAGQTDIHHLQRALNLLDKVNAPLVGCALNGFSNKHSYYGDYDYYYEYYYSDLISDNK